MSLVYLIPIILTIVWSIEYDRQAEFDTYKSHRFWLLYVLLSLITGVSYALGGDKQTYLTEFSDYSPYFSDIFREMEAGIMERGQMPGWVLLNVLARAIFDSFYFVQLVEAFFINYVVFCIFKRYTQRVFFCVLLYCLSFQYFNMNTEIMREAFAIGFCLLGAEMLFRQRYGWMCLLFLLALLFHLSAIVMVVLFPFMRFDITPRRFPFVLLASLGMWLLSNLVYVVMLQTMSGPESMIFKKLLSYASFSTGIVAYFIYMVIYLVAPYVMLHLGIRSGSDDEAIVRQKKHYVACYLCIAIVVPSYLILARLFNYVIPILLCITCDLLFTLFQTKRRFVPKVLCVLLFWGYSVFQYVTYMPKINDRYLAMWFPYTTVIDEGSYDRTYREKIHDALIDGDKAEDNTRDAE